MNSLLLFLCLLFATLFSYQFYLSRRRLRENQELKQLLSQTRVDRLIGAGHAYELNQSGVTFIHQTPGKTDQLLISIADIKNVTIENKDYAKLWINYQEIEGKKHEFESLHPFEIIERIYDDTGKEYYKRDTIARVAQSSELRSIEVLAQQYVLAAFGELKHWVVLNNALPSERELIIVLKYGTPLKLLVRGHIPNE